MWPFGVVPEQILNQLLIEETWLIEEYLVLVNEFFLDRSVVLFDITVHRRLALEVPVVGEVLFSEVAGEIFAKLRPVVRLHSFDLERTGNGETLEEIACIGTV